MPKQNLLSKLYNYFFPDYQDIYQSWLNLYILYFSLIFPIFAQYRSCYFYKIPKYTEISGNSQKLRENNRTMKFKNITKQKLGIQKQKAKVFLKLLQSGLTCSQQNKIQALSMQEMLQQISCKIELFNKINKILSSYVTRIPPQIFKQAMLKSIQKLNLNSQPNINEEFMKIIQIVQKDPIQIGSKLQKIGVNAMMASNKMKKICKKRNGLKMRCCNQCLDDMMGLDGDDEKELKKGGKRRGKISRKLQVKKCFDQKK